MTTVLVVDQDRFVLETTCEQLSRRGFLCHSASSADDAIDHLSGRRSALSGLITNINLPGDISGWEIARIVRQKNPEACVGYLSASGHRDWAVNGVPGSVLITRTAAGDVADVFVRLCDSEAAARSLDFADTIGMAAALQREREVLWSHFQHTSNFIAFLGGPEYRYTFANDAYVKLVERDVVGKTVVEAFPEVIAQGFVDILDRVYRSGEEFIAHGVEFVVELENGDRKNTFIDLVYRPMRDASGKIGSIFVEGEDLTERRAAQERIQALQNELIHIARVNAMGVLASTLAHELNQPLASIHNFMSAASIMAKQQSLDAPLLKCIEDTRSSALRAGNIIRKLRAMTSKRPVKREPVALEAALREAVAVATIGRRDATISYDIGTTAAVRADQVQLQQVMLNLIQNAVEAAGPDGPTLHISTSDEGPFVRICLSDSGPGIEDHILPRVFDAFSTTKAEGMGVGLSLCRTIIEAHGGTMTAHNNVSGGATFCFTLLKVLGD